MADPEARVVITGRDSTAAAFASADKHLRSFARSALQLRSIFAGFGVVVTGRMFANWIKDAIEVEKLTASQAKTIGDASKAIASLNSEFQGIARTIATELAPALERAAKFWKELLFPTGSQFGEGADVIREKLDAQIAEVERLDRLLKNQTDYKNNANPLQRFLFGDGAENVAETTKQLAAARVELQRLSEEWRKAIGAGGGQAAAPMFNRIGDVYDRFPGLKRPNIKLDDISAPTAEQLRAAQRITEQMATDVEKQVDAWREAKSLFDQGLISSETLTRFQDSLLQPIEVTAERMKTTVEKMKDQAADAAASMGENFRDAFSSWLMGAERSFSDLLRRMATEMAVSGIFEAFGSMFGGSTSGLGKFFASFFGGSRANEGPVSAGMVYKVHPGEAFFAPGMNGSVQHMAGAGAPIVINQNNTFSGGDSRQQAAMLAASNARLKQELKAEIQDLQRRGRF